VRDYATVSPTFWTGRTGRSIKAKGPEAIVVAFYLMTCPLSSMTGLYYLPLPTLAHETGLPLEGASKALRSLSEAGFAAYDEANEVVLIREMARYQIADTVEPKDNRHKGIVRDVRRYTHSPLFSEWFERYRLPFNLPEFEAPKPIAASPSEGATKPLRSQEQDQEQEHEQEIVAAPPAPTTLPGFEQPAAKASAEQPKRTAKPKADKPPLPFSVADALGAIASTACGRFVPGDRSTWTKGWSIALAGLVRRFPDLALWRRVGEHLASGGGWAKQTLGPEWAASDGFVAVVNLLPEWERRGKPVVDQRFAVVTRTVAQPTASQPHAPRKTFLGDEFAAAAKAAREDAR